VANRRQQTEVGGQTGEGKRGKANGGHASWTGVLGELQPLRRYEDDFQGNRGTRHLGVAARVNCGPCGIGEMPFTALPSLAISKPAVYLNLQLKMHVPVCLPVCLAPVCPICYRDFLSGLHIGIHSIIDLLQKDSLLAGSD